MGYPRVVFYHSVVRDAAPDDFYARKHPTVDQFAAHLDYFKSRYTMVAPDEFLAVYEGRSTRHYGRPPGMLTFDDGHLLVLRNAVPVLEAAGVPCLVFVVAGALVGELTPWYICADYLVGAARGRTVTFRGRDFRVDSPAGEMALKDAFKNRFITLEDESARRDALEELAGAVGVPVPTLADLPEHMAFLTPEQVAEVASHERVTVGSHALTHRCLDTLTDDEQTHELARSRDILAPLVGGGEMMVSYPNGAHNAVTRRLARELYRFGFGVELSVDKRDPFAYPRACLGRMSVQGVRYWLSFRRRYLYGPIKRLLGRSC